MDWFSAQEYWLSRFVFQRGLAIIYLIAFTVALNQFRPLLGARGLLPTPRFLSATSFRQAPSIFHWRYSDGMLAGVAWTGIVLAAAEILTLPEHAPTFVGMLVWVVLWALYLSIDNVGQIFYGFGWESLLLETGFLAIFLGSFAIAPPIVMLYLIRWLLFRLEFGAGLIKLRGDACWRKLTCLYYHHETQPMPNPMSWWFHHLPKPLHRMEVLANHGTQLIVPFALFAPQPVAGIAAAIMVTTQLWLMVSGNFSWLNAITVVLGLSVFDNRWLHWMFHVAPPHHIANDPIWFATIVLAVSALILVLSWRPARNLVSRRQLMNASFDSLHLVNTYGAFGSVTRERDEVVVEGTLDDVVTDTTVWREYEFKGKPTDLKRRPPQIAPYHLRLDWLMWFAGLSPAYAQGWFVPFAVKLLENDRPTLKLLGHNPFAEQPPRYVRARLYRYRFTTYRERKETGAWWFRRYLGDFLPPVSLRESAGQRLF
jgi:hypothetical protein